MWKEEFRSGMDVELEHGGRDSLTDVTKDDPVLTAIALAHLNEFPDYYTRLKRWKLRREPTGNIVRV